MSQEKLRFHQTKASIIVFIESYWRRQAALSS